MESAFGQRRFHHSSSSSGTRGASIVVAAGLRPSQKHVGSDTSKKRLLGGDFPPHLGGGGQKSCRVLDSLKKKKKRQSNHFAPSYRAGPKKRTSPERTIGSNGREEEEGIAMTLPCTRAHSLLCFPLVRRRRLAKRKTGKRRRCFWGSTAREAGALASTKGKPGTRVAALLPAGIPVCRSEHRKRQEFRGGGFDILYCALKSEHREIKNNTG